ncbi:hypothetical protein FBEOM_7922 [Fusarium beomiforme]|uniref:Uncharacterized protein n=1 Tax=Fusarium beomiforme TaxID=44412 RepID=A0A9P5AG60_9HYPO|nr:hypothetical protein FBEOM_7922 [Fusarium beomiforme]
MMSTSSRDAVFMGLNAIIAAGGPIVTTTCFLVVRLVGATPNFALYRLNPREPHLILFCTIRHALAQEPSPCRRRRLNPQNSSLILAPALLPARLSHCLLTPPVETPLLLRMTQATTPAAMLEIDNPSTGTRSEGRL